MINAWLLGAVLCVLTVILLRVFTARVYDILIVHMTSVWYKAVLGRLSNGDRVLDIGIGTATALLKNKDMLAQKNLTIVGVDYDVRYIKFAQKNIISHNVASSVRVVCKSLFDGDLQQCVNKPTEKLFDAAYFSGSWTLMPTPVEALRIAASLVKDSGKIYITQTFQRQTTPILGTLKPLLKHITTVNFGSLHYETDLQAYIQEAQEPNDGFKFKLVVEENSPVPGSIDNRYQGARLVVFTKVLV